MNRTFWTLLLLVLLLVAIVAPFSALAVLMLFTLVLGFAWALWTIVYSLFSSDAT